MITLIKKRDGREAPFDLTKITEAIEKAVSATGESGYSQVEQLAEKVLAEIEKSGKIPGVEDIQDIVERVLIDNGFARTAKAYILYRAERTRAREMNTRLMKVYGDLTFKESHENDLKRENANINGDAAMGAMLKYGSEGAKHFNELFVLNSEHSKAHQEGDIHIHDLDFLTLTTTCCQIDIEALFRGGFGTGHGQIREPNDIQSYAALACIAIQANQNDQHGGQSIPNFDYGMALGVAKTYIRLYRHNLTKALELLTGSRNVEELVNPIFHELQDVHGAQPALQKNEDYQKLEAKLLAERFPNASIIKQAQTYTAEKTDEEIERHTYQAMESFIHNLNTMHSRAGAQIPFSSVNYGLDTSPEGRLVIKSILLATESGLGNGETPIFPIQILKVKEGINYNPEDPSYDLFQLACWVSSKRLFPNFSFVDAPFNLQYYKPGRPETEIAYMGCRTRVVGNVHDESKEIIHGRGNLSFTTVNLPRIALLSGQNLDLFYQKLDAMISLVINQLLERFEIQARKKVKNFPFLMGQGIWLDSDKLDWEDEIREVLKHGTLSIGFIGLAETLKALIGEHHGQSERAQRLGLEIIGYMRKRMDEASDRTGLNFSLLATPAEGLSGRFVRMDRKRFGKIEGVTDKDYYTNSFHVPVYYETGIFHKIQVEAPYHALTNAGHISYVELDGDTSHNPAAFEKIVRTMKESGIGYGSINHPIDRDPVCGFTGIIGDECPACGRKEGQVRFERIRRITGYLVGTLDRFNDAKKAEERDRFKHSTVSGAVVR